MTHANSSRCSSGNEPDITLRHDTPTKQAATRAAHIAAVVAAAPPISASQYSIISSLFGASK